MSFEQTPPQDPGAGTPSTPPPPPPPPPAPEPAVGTGPTTAYPMGESPWGAPPPAAPPAAPVPPASPYGTPPPPPPPPAYASGVQGGPGTVPEPYPGYAYGAAAPSSQNAVIALVLAVLSWLFCPLILAVVALVLASKAKGEIEASGGRIGGAGLVTAAKVLSWLNIVLWGLFVLVFIALIAFGAFATSQVPTVVVPSDLPSMSLGA